MASPYTWHKSFPLNSDELNITSDRNKDLDVSTVKSNLCNISADSSHLEKLERLKHCSLDISDNAKIKPILSDNVNWTSLEGDENCKSEDYSRLSSNKSIFPRRHVKSKVNRRLLSKCQVTDSFLSDKENTEVVLLHNLSRSARASNISANNINLPIDDHYTSQSKSAQVVECLPQNYDVPSIVKIKKADETWKDISLIESSSDPSLPLKQRKQHKQTVCRAREHHLFDVFGSDEDIDKNFETESRIYRKNDLRRVEASSGCVSRRFARNERRDNYRESSESVIENSGIIETSEKKNITQKHLSSVIKGIILKNACADNDESIFNNNVNLNEMKCFNLGETVTTEKNNSRMKGYWLNKVNELKKSSAISGSDKDVFDFIASQSGCQIDKIDLSKFKLKRSIPRKKRNAAMVNELKNEGIKKRRILKTSENVNINEKLLSNVIKGIILKNACADNDESIFNNNVNLNEMKCLNLGETVTTEKNNSRMKGYWLNKVNELKKSSASSGSDKDVFDFIASQSGCQIDKIDLPIFNAKRTMPAEKMNAAMVNEEHEIFAQIQKPQQISEGMPTSSHIKKRPIVDTVIQSTKKFKKLTTTNGFNEIKPISQSLLTGQSSLLISSSPIMSKIRVDAQVHREPDKVESRHNLAFPSDIDATFRYLLNEIKFHSENINEKISKLFELLH